MGDVQKSLPDDDSQNVHFMLREGRRFIGSVVARLKNGQKALQSRGRRKRRSETLTNLDLWELLQRAGYYCDPTQIRRIQQGEAPVDPFLARLIARALNASEAETALLSHAAGGEGVSTYLLKLLGLESYVSVCTLRADETVRGEITIEEFDDIVRQVAATMLLELMRSTQQSQDAGADTGMDA